MRIRMRVRRGHNRDTQLHKIRDLMFAASQRGAWMTLGEIARLTEIGEASISAQLRHLRKRRHGRHRVEKRRRMARAVAPKDEPAHPKDEIHAATVAVGVPRAAASPHVTTDWEGIDAEACA